MIFPDDETLIARGKYSTLSNERRGLLRALRDDAESIADRARRIVRSLGVGDLQFGQEQAKDAERITILVQQRIGRLMELAALLDELRPPCKWNTQNEEGE